VTISISQAIELAIRHHQAGQLREAEMVLTQVLRVQPKHPDALRWLGLVAQSTGHFPEALQLLNQALRINPRSIESR